MPPEQFRCGPSGCQLCSPGEDTTWSHLCLLLDYDGTLAPHGSHPDLTIMPRETKEVATSSVRSSETKGLDTFQSRVISQN